MAGLLALPQGLYEKTRDSQEGVLFRCGTRPWRHFDAKSASGLPALCCLPPSCVAFKDPGRGAATHALSATPMQSCRAGPLPVLLGWVMSE